MYEWEIFFFNNFTESDHLNFSFEGRKIEFLNEMKKKIHPKT